MVTLRRIVVLLALLGAASAQDAPAPKPEQLVELGFTYRRQGHFDAASAALEQAIERFPERSEERRTALLETYEIAWVQSKFEKAARVARGLDSVRVARALLEAGRGEDALRGAKEEKDALAEGIALRGLGRSDAALEALGRAGAAGHAERADLLLALGRFADAAKAFEAAGDLHGRALALDKSGDSQAAQAWEAARGAVSKQLEDLIAKGQEAKNRAASAQGGAARDRARHALAAAHDDLSRAYERYALVQEKLGDKAKAKKLAELAVDFVAEERRTLSDGGKDRFGEAKARSLSLDAREAALRERVRALR